MKRNVLILEDHIDSGKALAKVVKECDPASVIFYTKSSAEAYKYAMEERIDLFLVDIMLEPTILNDISGLIFADKIRSMERYRFVPLIFVTSLGDYQMSAFQNLHCYSYIEKPFDFQKVREVVQEALTFPVKDERRNRYLYYRKEGLLYTLDTEWIIYIKAVGRNLVLYTEGGEVEICYKSCSSILRELNEENFLQCSRKIIVNRKYILCVDETNRYVMLQNGNSVEIGRAFKKGFLQDLKRGN